MGTIKESVRESKIIFHCISKNIFFFFLFYSHVMDITEVENIKKRWQEYTELCKRHPDNHDGVITHPEPDILECEVKWAFKSTTMNKASRAISNPKRQCC